MSSKLRPLYDKLYVSVDVALLACHARSAARKKAHQIAPKFQLDEDYSHRIRPYWKQFCVRTPGKYWFRTYGERDVPADERCIPDTLWFNRIIPHFNTLLFAQALQDKCLHNLFVPDIRRPKTIVKNIAGIFYDDALNLLTREQAVARCHNAGRILAKPSVGSGQGHDIRFYDSASLSDSEIEDIFRLYRRNYIIQEKMTQHEALAVLNPRSFNTIRIVSFLFQNEVHILSAILRIGGGANEVDNVSQGGYQCTIRPDGTLDKYALTKLNGRWENVEVCGNGIRFENYPVPSYVEAVAAVKTAAAKMGHFRILGWDIGIAPNGEPVLVEYNVIPGQNQGTCGPSFGSLTDAVLTEVFGKRE